MIEYKEIKSFSDKNGKFYGYASIFNVKDSYDDIILNGAFRDSLKSSGVNNIKLLWQHDKTDVIGKFSIIREDSVGLYVEGELENINDKNLKVYSYVKNKFIDGLSIGYRVKDAEFDKKGCRILKKIDLLEISIVSSPANKYSSITYCKSLSNFFVF